MKPQELKSLDRRMTEFLADLLLPMGRGERRNWASVCVEGLVLDGERTAEQRQVNLKSSLRPPRCDLCPRDDEGI